ncbi:MAG: hypothetical protein H0V51_00270 [Chloroflexi bacterium]|nr:hypothetical protein [Chloroflexota bacterium]
MLTIGGVILLALWILAVRYGYDSRDGVRSKEQDLAAYGVSWRDLTARA